MRPRRVPFALAVAAILAAVPARALGDWEPPRRLSAADRASYAVPAAALAGGGRAVVAWIRVPSGASSSAGRVQLSVRTGPGGRWTRPLTVSGPGASRPRAALNDAGAGAVAWSRGRDIAAATRRGPGGDWLIGRAVEAGGPVHDLALGVDRGGRAAIVWSERHGAGFLVRIAAERGQGRWSVRPPRLAIAGPGAPALALSPGKGALAAWIDDGQLRAARTRDGAFESPRDVSSEGAGAPAVALSPSGAGLAAWSSRLPGGTSVMLGAGRRSGSPRWGSPEDLGIGESPVTALNDRGDAVVAWGLGEPGDAQGIEAVTRRGGGGWSASTVVARGECSCSLSPARAAIDPRGAAVVSWRRDAEDGRRSGGVAALPLGARMWARPIAGPAAASDAPAVAAAAGGRGLAAWARADRGAGVWAAALGS
jgi:hypothetical protein